ncbi:hypothetical protein EJ07DRAFT_163521 [Lizonia empirigonia]|nr:hypothetical protein EJ07DRAFT_163521 [Lizonia empirigonia]
MLSKVRKISKLNQTIHRLSIRSVLAKHENVRLKEALINERQRRKRGKALSLEAEEEYHGGAVFWSPRKVKEARDRQLQQGLEEEELQHQRAEAARLREEQRQEKLQAVQQRRAARAAARLMRQEEKARRAQQRLQRAQKTSQKSKKRSLKASIKAASKKRAAAQPQGGGKASGAAAGPPPSQSRHGRAIKLPSKYR